MTKPARKNETPKEYLRRMASFTSYKEEVWEVWYEHYPEKGWAIVYDGNGPAHRDWLPAEIANQLGQPPACGWLTLEDLQ